MKKVPSHNSPAKMRKFKVNQLNDKNQGSKTSKAAAPDLSQEARDAKFYSEDNDESYYLLGRKALQRKWWEIAQRLQQIDEVREIYAPRLTEEMTEAMGDFLKFGGTKKLNKIIELENARPYSPDVNVTPSLIEDFTRYVVTRKFEPLQGIVDALKATRKTIKSLHGFVCVWVIAACDIIKASGRNRDDVTWDDVQKKALELCAKDLAWQKLDWTPEKLRSVKVFLKPEDKTGRRPINWQRVQKDLGLKLKPAPAGRPKKSVLEARELQRLEAEITMKYVK